MNKLVASRLVVPLAMLCGLAAIVGCGGGGGGGGAPAGTSPSITTASLPAGVRGQLYTIALGAAGGTAPYTWSHSGLPPGIALGHDTGILSGTPTAADTYAPTFTVTDSAGRAATVQLSLLIALPPAPAIATASLPAGAQARPYAAQLVATGGTPPYSWTAAGLPAGVTLDPPTGALTGTPTASGTFTATFTVTDINVLSGSRSLAVVINPPEAPVITTASLPAGALSAP